MDTRRAGCNDVNVTELAQKDVSHKASLLRFMNIQVHISEFATLFTRQRRILLKSQTIKTYKKYMQINPQLL
jgi:hypothetical protein